MKKHVVRLFSHAISDTSIVGILNKSIIVVVENSSLAVYFASSLCGVLLLMGSMFQMAFCGEEKDNKYITMVILLLDKDASDVFPSLSELV